MSSVTMLLVVGSLGSGPGVTIFVGPHSWYTLKTSSAISFDVEKVFLSLQPTVEGRKR
jgi:hypothetical protein